MKKIFRWLRLIVFIMGVLLFELSSEALVLGRSHFDGKNSVIMSFPPSLAMDFWLAYSFRFKIFNLETENEIVDRIDAYSYSYLRPHLRAFSSPLMNRMEARLDLYPVSFLGGTLGFSQSQFNFGDIEEGMEKWTGYSCNTLGCDGVLKKWFFEFKLKGAFENFFSQLYFRMDSSHSNETLAILFDPEMFLAVENPKEKIFKSSVLLGHKLGEIPVGLKYEWVRAVRADSILHSIFINSSYPITAFTDLEAIAGYRWRKEIGFSGVFASLRWSYHWGNEPTPGV